MKLTQKWVNDSCDNYDQNSDKNESWCSQATTTTANTHTGTHSHPQKKSERNNIKSKKKMVEKTANPTRCATTQRDNKT